jgi:EAL domain-containing protein (putative c-di-GMP-specific phosphodiesterase class I)
MKKYRFTEQMQTAYESMQVPFAIYQFINKRVVTLVLSDGFCELFGYEDKAQAYYDMDHDMYKDTHPDDMARIADAAFRFATEGGKYEVIYRTSMKNGAGYRMVHALGRHVYTEDGIRLAHVWYTDEGTYAEDPHGNASELKQAMSNALHVESMEKARSYDFLTGLPNMTYFFERAEAEKEHILAQSGQPILLYINFSGMKFFNARHGFAEGDKMLQSFARMLSQTFSNENSCRIGADHFAVVTEEAGVEEKLNGIFREFGELYGGKTPPVHVGIYPYRIEDVFASSACDRAKLACSSLKGSYTSAFCYYDAELREDTLLKHYIIENFDTAIHEKWIQVYLQPIVRAVNERVCDVEALARWNDPEKGVLSPAVFIPVLEETGLICKLDLYMLDRVLEAIKIQLEEGFLVVPHSINISRADFDACDIVEEIRKRVDAAGIKRDRITVEITESVIGSNLEFMKAQIERFRKLGFSVWMDDFGSGYSSVEVLQSIKFDVIKFDMSFLRQLEDGKERKVILTDLMRMASSLDTDTVCEGVETKSQVRFLREIGCSKLQGYYYSRPIPFDAIREMHKSSTLIENENSEESEYYESIGKVNLFDLGVVANEGENALQNTFNNIPIAVVEVRDGEVKYVRNNRAYQDFARRYFEMDVADGQMALRQTEEETISVWLSVVKQCSENGNRIFFDNKTPDGSVIHSFARRVAVNPVTGSAAVAIAVLSITDSDEKTTYADIAKSLAADYYNIYVIDLDTNDYIEYSSNVGGEELSIERHGKEFFESARRETMTRIYEEDREPFLALFTKENVLRDLDAQGVFTTTYRLIDTGTPMYVNMKITRMQGGNRIILGISIIDAHMKQQEEERRLRQETITLGRIAALAGNYIALYIVDPVTEQYIKYDSSQEYTKLGLTERGEEFFDQVKKDGAQVIYPEDMERLLCVLTKDNVLHEIRQNGLFIHNYRLLIEGKYVPVSLRATLVKEPDGEKIILGVNKLFAKEPTANELGVIYSHIARALVRGYSELFYVNIDTDEFIEFQIDDNFDVLTETRRSKDFFEGCKRDVKLFVHPEDHKKFIRAMDRDFLKEELSRSNVFEMTYRRLRNGKPCYVKMSITRMEDDKSIVVMAVSDIDDLSRVKNLQP